MAVDALVVAAMVLLCRKKSDNMAMNLNKHNVWKFSFNKDECSCCCACSDGPG